MAAKKKSVRRATPPDRRTIWVGFDLGGTKMMATVYDSTFKLLGKSRKRTKGFDGLENGLVRVTETLTEALAKANVEADQLAGIGIGSPGPLDLKRGVLLDLPNLGWSNVPIKKYLERTLGCPAVVLNDVDAGTYGEARFGAGRKARTVLGVFPGTGVGAGCVYDGRILTGNGRSILELGHCCVNPGGVLCGCGNRGCLETVASRLAIASAAAAAAYRGEAPRLMELAGMDIARIRSGVLAEAIAAGDHSVETIVTDAAAWLGVGISFAVNLLLPDVVVLGGGLVEAMPELYLKAVTQSAMEHCMPPFRGAFRIATAKLADYATAKGAAAWAQQSLQPSGV